MIHKGKGQQSDLTPLKIFTLACDQGWMSSCGDLAGLYFMGKEVSADKLRAVELLDTACEGDHAMSCSNLGLIYKNGNGIPADNAKALAYLNKACGLGMDNACRLLARQER